MLKTIADQWELILLLGVLVGGVIGWIATAKVRSVKWGASEEAINAYKAALAASDQLSARLEAVHKAALEAMTSERDAYRDKSHAVAQELTAASLKIQEIELRPDLTAVIENERSWHEQRREFYEKMAGQMKTQSDLLTDVVKGLKQHEEAMDKRMTAHTDILARIATFMDVGKNGHSK